MFIRKQKELKVIDVSACICDLEEIIIMPVFLMEQPDDVNGDAVREHRKISLRSQGAGILFWGLGFFGDRTFEKIVYSFSSAQNGHHRHFARTKVSRKNRDNSHGLAISVLASFSFPTVHAIKI